MFTQPSLKWPLTTEYGRESTDKGKPVARRGRKARGLPGVSPAAETNHSADANAGPGRFAGARVFCVLAGRRGQAPMDRGTSRLGGGGSPPLLGEGWWWGLVPLHPAG